MNLTDWLFLGAVVFIIAIIAFCGFFPIGFSTVIKNNTIICEKCCTFNYWLADKGVTQYKCETLYPTPGNSGGTEEDTSYPDDSQDDAETGIVCAGIWNPSISFCAAGICNNADEECVYHPDTLFSPDYCSCEVVETCTDTDGGQDVLVKGTCTDADASVTDYCSTTSYVAETWCAEDGTCWGASMPCPAGTTCIDGECK